MRNFQDVITGVGHTLTISGEYNGTTGALITNSASTAQADVAAGIANIYRVDISTLLSGVGPNQTYGGELFDLNLGSGLSRAIQASGTGSKANYVATNVAIPLGAQDANAVPVTGLYLMTNQDAGPSTVDLVAITTILNKQAVGALYDQSFDPMPDPRTTLGQGSPFKIGNVFVKWDGSFGATLTLQHATYINYSYTIDGFGISSGLFDETTTTAGNGTLTFVPEPASIVLIGLGGLGLAAIARRRS